MQAKLQPIQRRNNSMGSSWDVWSFLVDPFEVAVCVLVAVGVFVFVKFRPRNSTHTTHLSLREFIKGHNFAPTDLFGYPLYCNICEENVVEGFQCDACGIVAHPHCAHHSHREIRCKALSSFGPVMKHHIIKGWFSSFLRTTLFLLTNK
jgi:hypothetical protein